MSASVKEALWNSTDEKIKRFREDYPDIFEAVVATVDQVASIERAHADSRLAGVEQRVAETGKSKFVEALSRAHPDWQTISQSDPNWPVWLSQKERYQSKTRLELLREATARFDAESVINMLRDFKANPTVGGAHPGGGSPRTSPQGEVISRQFIKTFYAEKAKGYYRLREKEAQAIEARINRPCWKGESHDT